MKYRWPYLVENQVEEIESILNALVRDGYFCFTFNTQERDLDIVSWDVFNNQCLPLIQKNCELVSNNLWRKI